MAVERLAHPPRRRRPIEEPSLTDLSVTSDPLPRTTDADAGSLGRQRQHPPFTNNPTRQNPTTVPAESGVTVDSPLTAKQFEVEDAFGTLFTEEQLHTTVTRYAGLPAQAFFDCVIGDVRQFSERKSFDDDVCVVGMEVQHTG